MLKEARPDEPDAFCGEAFAILFICGILLLSLRIGLH